MDEYLVYFTPYLAVGFGIMLAPFISHRWPQWPTNFVEFCAEMANGVWVAGIAFVLLVSIGLPVPLAAMLSWPVMFFAGRYLVSMFERMDEQVRETKRRGWEAHRKKEAEERKAKERCEL